MARPYKYTPEQIEQKFEEYKEWLLNGDGAIHKRELIKYKDSYEVAEYTIPSPPDQRSFCLFLKIDKQTFYNWLDKDKQKDNEELFDIATRVDDWIKSAQIRGATANEYNASIVARMNGITETVNVTGQALQPVIINVLNKPMDLKGLYEPITECEILPNSPE